METKTRSLDLICHVLVSPAIILIDIILSKAVGIVIDWPDTYDAPQLLTSSLAETKEASDSLDVQLCEAGMARLSESTCTDLRYHVGKSQGQVNRGQGYDWGAWYIKRCLRWHKG